MAFKPTYKAAAPESRCRMTRGTGYCIGRKRLVTRPATATAMIKRPPMVAMFFVMILYTFSWCSVVVLDRQDRRGWNLRFGIVRVIAKVRGIGTGTENAAILVISGYHGVAG